MLKIILVIWIVCEWHILMIQLPINFPAIFPKAINAPCTVESPTPIPRHEWLKVSNRYLQIWEYLPQLIVKNIEIFRPIRRDRIESFEFSQDNISESGRSNSKTIQTIIETSKISDNESHSKSASNFKSESNDNIDKLGHKFVKGLWIGLIISSIMFFIFNITK